MKSFLLLFFLFPLVVAAQDQPTYAEKLGYPKGAKVVILHVDDVGMSYESNRGAIDAMTKGVANSCSIMMPCGWVPDYFHYLKDNPQIDAGLHLTLTSEWKGYRWGPLSGKPAVPGLVDAEGAMWHDVPAVVKNATADEVAREIDAQIERARAFGWEPTHLDSHMGTLFASPAFIEKYIAAGIKHKIPVMFPAGHATLIAQQRGLTPEEAMFFRMAGKQLWDAGLPVLDDLFNETYGWNLPDKVPATDKNLRAFKTKKYIEGLRRMKPGITMMIMHCTISSDIFPHISDSGPTRRGDLLAMTDPALKKYITDNKIILTTWRELMERRKNIKP